MLIAKNVVVISHDKRDTDQPASKLGKGGWTTEVTRVTESHSS